MMSSPALGGSTVAAVKREKEGAWEVHDVKGVTGLLFIGLKVERNGGIAEVIGAQRVAAGDLR